MAEKQNSIHTSQNLSPSNHRHVRIESCGINAGCFSQPRSLHMRTSLIVLDLDPLRVGNINQQIRGQARHLLVAIFIISVQ